MKFQQRSPYHWLSGPAKTLSPWAKIGDSWRVLRTLGAEVMRKRYSKMREVLMRILWSWMKLVRYSVGIKPMCFTFFGYTGIHHSTKLEANLEPTFDRIPCESIKSIYSYWTSLSEIGFYVGHVVNIFKHWWSDVGVSWRHVARSQK